MRLRLCVALLVASVWACDSSQVPVQAPNQDAGTVGAQRIVSLSPHLTEMLFAVGAGTRVVGAVEYSDYPAAARDIPRVGNAFRVDYEVIRTLEPDLIVVWESGNPPEIVARLLELGYRVVAFEPAGLDSIPDELERLGSLTGDAATATQTAAELRSRIAVLGANVADRPVRRVFWQIAADPFYTVTGRHLISEIISLCGGSNVFEALPGLAPAVTLEAILEARPEVIIASTGPDDQAWRGFWRQWPQVPAVRDDRLYSINPDLISRPGPRIVEGAEAVCAALAEANSTGR